MPRQKGDSIVNGKLVRAAQLESTSSTAVAVYPQEPVHETIGMNLSSSLASDLNMNTDPLIVLKFKGTGAPEVTMTGRWDGRLLSAAMRAIEKQYEEVRRHATVWAMKRSHGNI